MRWPLRRREPTPAYREYLQQLEQLRRLRADVQALQALLQRVRNGTAVLKEYAATVECTLRRGEQWLIETERIQQEGQEVRYLSGDGLESVRNIWEQLKACPPLARPSCDPATPQELLHHLATLDDHCNQLLYHIGAMTIPDRLNDWLRQSRAGHYIPFHPVFEDELPSPGDRGKVLNQIAWAPKFVEVGLVDPSSGLVYRYDPRPWVQWLTVIVAVGAFVAATWFVSVAPTLLDIGNRPNLLNHWFAVLAGIVVHVVVATAKRTQAQAALPPVTAIGDLPAVVNARVGQLLMKLILALFGLLGSYFASAGVATGFTLFNAFLVGYSLDSVVALFATTVEQRAATQIATIRQQVSGSGGK